MRVVFLISVLVLTLVVIYPAHGISFFIKNAAANVPGVQGGDMTIPTTPNQVMEPTNICDLSSWYSPTRGLISVNECSPGTTEPGNALCNPDIPVTSSLVSVDCPPAEGGLHSDGTGSAVNPGSEPSDIVCDPNAPVTSSLVAVNCPEICDNGIDDNNNGLIDAEDPECTIDTTNHAPIAHTSGPSRVTEGSSVALSGAQSEDPDDDKLTYSWTQTGGPAVSLSDLASASPSFSAVSSQDTTCIDGLPTTTLSFQLVVSDGQLDSAPSTVLVKVTRNYDPLSVTVVSDSAVRSGEYALVSARATGGTGCGQIGYQWTQTGGMAGVLTNPTSNSPGFKAPSPARPEDVTLSVVANEGESNNAQASATIRVCPPLNVASLGNREVNIPLIGSGDCDYSRIDVRAKSAGGVTTAHLFIVLTDQNGKETVFRGGPTASQPLPLVGGGKIIATWQDYEPGAIDWSEDAPSVTILKGLSSVSVMDGCFAKEVGRINLALIDYYITGPNSNTVVKTLLTNCNAPVITPQGTQGIGFPGFGMAPL